MIDESVYQELINEIQFKDIQLLKLDVNKIEESERVELNVEIGGGVESVYREDENLNVVSSFSIKAKELTGEATEFTIDFQFRLKYHISAELLFDDMYYGTFADRNAPINMWPYARELVSSITSRMGYPTFYLPLYKDSE